ncbi:MAG: helix-turn-helix domain-containing protein [Christensenellales bacterium]|jgi:transcriptional regulator with XRE-family HTH domain
MNDQIKLIAERISELRDICKVSTGEMAEVVGVTEPEYLEYEQGMHDFTFSQLYRICERLGVDITNILTGDTPKLKDITLVRKGEGLVFERNKEYKYQHLAFAFRNRRAEPFLVVKEYDADEEFRVYDNHEGQEFDYVISGTLKIDIGGNVFVLSPGDSIYYNASYKHSMKALGGRDCEFLAIILK